MVFAGPEIEPLSFLYQEPPEEVLCGIPRQEPFVENQKVVDLVWEYDEFKVNIVGSQGLHQTYGLREGNVSVVVSVYEQDG